MNRGRLAARIEQVPVSCICDWKWSPGLRRRRVPFRYPPPARGRWVRVAARPGCPWHQKLGFAF